MKGRMDTDLGSILIDADVISTYAGSVAVECFGIVGMAAVNMKDGLVKLLRKDSLMHVIWRKYFGCSRESDQQCEVQSRRIHRHGN